VVATARALIEEEGLDAVSFRRLAQRLGVTAPALYAYVSDKDDLLRSVSAEELISIVKRYERGEGEDPVVAVRRFCHQYIDYAVSHAALYKAMWQYPPWEIDADRSGFGLPLAVSQFAIPYQAVLDALDQGRLRRQHPLMVAIALWTMCHGLAEVLLQGIPGDGALRRQFCDEVIDVVLRGLGDERPRPAPGDDGDGTGPDGQSAEA
jgi:AcrR family transcriptional regulator